MRQRGRGPGRPQEADVPGSPSRRRSRTISGLFPNDMPNHTSHKNRILNLVLGRPSDDRRPRSGEGAAQAPRGMVPPGNQPKPDPRDRQAEGKGAQHSDKHGPG